MTRPSRPLWDKGHDLDAAAQRFCAGDDVILDRQLLPHDIRASRAHVAGLARIGILSETESTALLAALDELAALVARGSFILDDRFEDGHSAIEHFLGERIGEVGRKVHTGRSRNDQVLVAMRLWLREQLVVLRTRCLDLADACLARAAATVDLAMPGYTHLQRAVPTSFAALLAGHAEAQLDDAEVARNALQVLDACPLGTAAGHGVNLPLDRDGVAHELGFSRVQVSPVYAQNSRGKLELLAVQALHQALLDLRRLAWDLSLFATAEFAFVRLPDAYTTGSSIMPNKRNPDVVELLRALPALSEGAMAELSSLLSLPSGYHRDLQASKAPTLRAFDRGLAGLALAPALIATLELDPARMRAAIDPELHATDRAIELARAGVPFRDAYQQVAREMHTTLQDRSPEHSLAARVSLGGAANLGLDRLHARLHALRGA
jgi:argininosuccinate lyase